MSNPTIVKTASPVEDQESYLHQWDTAARKNFLAFEQRITGLRQGISQLYFNPLTSFRDPCNFNHRH